MPNKSHIGVTGGQHGGKAGGLGFAPLAFAGLFKVPVIAHLLERALAIYLFLQPAQRLVHRLAFFESYFGQKISLPFRVGAGPCLPARSKMFHGRIPCLYPAPVSTGKNAKKTNGRLHFTFLGFLS